MTDDRDYFYHRAEAELDQAQRSDIPEAVQAHYALATAYLERAYDTDDLAELAVSEDR